MHGSFNTFAHVQHYVHDMQRAECGNEIAKVLSCATRSFGFDHFTLLLGNGHRPNEAPTSITDLPSDLIRILGSNDNSVRDPVQEASRKRITPFHWTDLPDIIHLTPNHHHYLQLAASHGLHNGWTVPLHLPGESSGSCSFVLSGAQNLQRQDLPAAQHLAFYAFEAARRVNSHGTRTVKLTPRQVECTILAARGKSDWVAGQLLGLAPDTVHKYLEQAKSRFGVSSRTELVVRALYEGQISFSDLLD